MTDRTEKYQLDDDQEKQLQKLVSDELLRKEIRNIIDSHPRSKLDALFRHPLLVVFLGFVLTGLIATWFAKELENAQLRNQQLIEDAAATRAAGIKAVNNLASLVYERYVRAELLASSIKRDVDLDEIRERKNSYDAAYVDWNTNLQRTHLTIRQIVGAKEYSRIESHIQYGLTPFLAEVDSYLTNGYDARIQRNDSWTYEPKKVREPLSAILNCGYVITQYLWVTANLYGSKDAEWQNTRDKAVIEMESRCPRQGT